MVPEIIAQLQANTTSFPTIQNAWTMEPVESLSADIPVLYVYDGARSADPELGETTCHRQRITKTVHVFIVCEPDAPRRTQENRFGHRWPYRRKQGVPDIDQGSQAHRGGIRGWLKTVGGLRKTKLIGRAKLAGQSLLCFAAYNLVRMGSMTGWWDARHT